MRETKAFPFEIKGADDGGFEGYAGCFGNVDEGGDIIDPRAFDRALPRFLEKGVIALYHDWTRAIGKPKDAHVDSKGLYISARYSDVPDARVARTLINDKVVQGLSIGYDVPRQGKAWLEKWEDVEDYWRSIRYNPTPDDLMAKERGGPVRLLKEVYPVYEVSPVPFPMNRTAGIESSKGSEALHLPFDEHTAMVLAEVKDLCERAADLARTRGEQGRALNPQRQARFKSLRDDIDALLRDFTPAGDDADVLELLADCERLTAYRPGLIA